MTWLPSNQSVENIEAKPISGVRRTIPIPFASVTFSDGYHAMVLEKWGVNAAAMTFSRPDKSFYLSSAIGFPDQFSQLERAFSRLSVKISSNGFMANDPIVSLNSVFFGEDPLFRQMKRRGFTFLRVFQINDILASLGYWFMFFDNYHDAECIGGKVEKTLESSPYPHDLDEMMELTTDSNHVDEVITNWVKLLDQRDKETEEHTERVAWLAVKLAEKIGVPAEEQWNIYRGALLHDVGKIFIPNEILFKPGSLSSEEWTIMKMHPVIVNEVLTRFSIPPIVLEIPHCHHEKWDGTGYPNNLAADEIPLPARIFAVVDVWDALLSDRPYRPKFSSQEAVDYIRDQAGAHFDPMIAGHFLEMVEAETL